MMTIKVEESSITLTNSVIDHSLYAGIRLINSNSVINNLTVSNTTKCKTYGGTGLSVQGGNPSLSNLSFSNNEGCNLVYKKECLDNLPPQIPDPPPILDVTTPAE